jgi:hypothetical protein
VGFEYEFTEPALRQFQQLEPWLGEDTIDELESLAAAPAVDRLWSPTGFVHDFVRTQGSATNYVFLTILPDVAANKLRITSVGLYTRR